MSQSQKVLKTVSVLEILLGIFMIAFAVIMVILGGGAIGSGEAAIDDETAAKTVVVGVVFFIAAVVYLIVGGLGIRAARDASKIMPVWVISIINIIHSAYGLISYLRSSGETADLLGTVAALVLHIAMFAVANNIMRQKA